MTPCCCPRRCGDGPRTSRLKPEEEEILRKREELAAIRAALAERELELAGFTSPGNPVPILIISYRRDKSATASPPNPPCPFGPPVNRTCCLNGEPEKTKRNCPGHRPPGEAPTLSAPEEKPLGRAVLAISCKFQADTESTGGNGSSRRGVWLRKRDSNLQPFG